MKGIEFLCRSYGKRSFILNCVIFFLLSATSIYAQDDKATSVLSVTEATPKWVLVIHAGAGGFTEGNIKPEIEQAYKRNLDEALNLGSGILTRGGSSVDAVEKVVRFMEDCGTFNAGKGAVLDENGVAELDASIMDGNTGMAGAVAGVGVIKNPITAARFIMTKSDHVMLVGTGAEMFAKMHGLELVLPSYFINTEKLEILHKSKSNPVKEKSDKEKHGTVGAVALDLQGNLAAATSTGGILGKTAGRVGDSPVIGAGTYANNKTCAVSCTGHGEYFIRNVAAYDLSAMMEYLKMPLDQAANLLIMGKIKGKNGDGGLIAVDKDGNVAMPFNTKGMCRGVAKSSGEHDVEIY